MRELFTVGIETSGQVGSVALCEGERLLAAYSFQKGARHAREIVAAIDAVLGEAGLEKGRVDAVAVSEGPGSFTGLRVGVTAAKTLAYALGWKAVGVPSLEVMVQNVPGGGDECACPMLDARRGWVYAALFRWDGRGRVEKEGMLAGQAREVRHLIPKGSVVFGSAVRAYPELFGGERYAHLGPEHEIGRAEHVARLGRRILSEGGEVSPMALVPRYYRLTEAEEKLAASRK